MRKRRCPGGVKVAGFHFMSEVSRVSEVSGSIPVSGICFLLILLYLPCVYHVIHIC